MTQLGPQFDPTLGGTGALAGDAVGPLHGNVVKSLTGQAGVVALASGTLIRQTQPAAAPASVVGTANITNAALYGGGGTLDGLTLRLNVNQQGLSTLVFAGAGNTLNEAALLAAIVGKAAWNGVGAVQGGGGGNKLVLSGAISIIVDAASTALAALGLAAGTYLFVPVNEVALQLVAANGNVLEMALTTSQGLIANEIDNQWHWGINALNTDPAKPGLGNVIEQLFNGKFEAYQQAHGVAFANPTRWYAYNYDPATGVNSIQIGGQTVSIGNAAGSGGAGQDTTALSLFGAGIQRFDNNDVLIDVATILAGTIALVDAGPAITVYAFRANAAGQRLILQATAGTVEFNAPSMGGYGHAAVAQPARAGQLTDNSGGASGGNTIAVIAGAVDPTAATKVSTANAIATLAAKVNAIEDKISGAGTGNGMVTA